MREEFSDHRFGAWLAVAAAALLIFAAPLLAVDNEAADATEDFRSGEPLDAPMRAYPADPVSDISWSGGTNTVTDVQNAFNNARTNENSQLGLSLPMLTLPSQGTWDAMSNSEKALWLINRDRTDRGVHALHGVETNVTNVAQAFAQWLLDNDAWGHSADGSDPWSRLDANPAIGACHDSLSVAENLAVFVTSGSSIGLPVERSVYNWMYFDSGSSWGHRHAILWYPYNDNSGTPGQEGFLGIGRANGGPYQGPFTSSWPFAEMIVMNVFDPCSSWVYNDDEIFTDGFESGTTSAWDAAVP